MIIWLASYPKSGNTFLRSLLSSYLFTNDGIFNFEVIKNIKQFPSAGIFKNLGIDSNNDLEVVKNYIYVQEEINKADQNNIRILKTHCTLHKVNGYSFTNLENTLGAIHIVRDPRNVISSYANHYRENLDQAFESLKRFSVYRHDNGGIISHVGSWSSHYNVWKTFKSTNKYLLIKYEDLLSDTRNNIIKILKFIYTINKVNFILDEVKLKNTIQSTKFEKVKILEKKEGFNEAVYDKENKPIPFFNSGPDNDWRKKLPDKIRIKIEEAFKQEMVELGYL